MAVNHYGFTGTNNFERLVRGGLRHLEVGIEDCNDALATIATMIDGDGSNATHFTYVTAKFQFTDNATAKAAWEELNSVMAKLNTDGSVSNVNAALLQAFARFRG